MGSFLPNLLINFSQFIYINYWFVVVSVFCFVLGNGMKF